MNKSAIIVAGGTGTRMGGDLPKQFLPLAGEPVMVHTVRRFLTFDPAMPVMVVQHPGSLAHWQALCQKHFSLDDQQRLFSCPGGAQRTESVYNGLLALAQHLKGLEGFLVAIHDAVRPFVGKEMLVEAFDTAEALGASVCCVPVKSSLREKTDAGSKAIDRSRFFHVQTPQTFRLAELIQAYKDRPHDRFTDDASLFEAAGKRVELCAGSYENLKLTTPEDMFVAEGILKRYDSNAQA